jgi:hypothetical protein
MIRIIIQFKKIFYHRFTDFFPWYFCAIKKIFLIPEHFMLKNSQLKCVIQNEIKLQKYFTTDSQIFSTWLFLFNKKNLIISMN